MVFRNAAHHGKPHAKPRRPGVPRRLTPVKAIKQLVCFQGIQVFTGVAGGDAKPLPISFQGKTNFSPQGEAY